MKEEIIHHLDNPSKLEKMYRDNKSTFKREFNSIYLDIQDKAIAQVWNERLNFENEEISWGAKNELAFIIVASLIAGIIAKIPAFTSIKMDYFYPRNIAFIVFPLLIAYFSWKQKIQIKTNVIISITIFITIIYINLLPDYSKSDTLILACIHLPLFLWAILGYTFIGGSLKNHHQRLNFLRYNGDLVVMTTIILITGAILTGFTKGLFFAFIRIDISEFYFKYVIVWGLAAAPIVATYLVQTNPLLVSKVSPIIAKVFTPLVLVTLVVYLIAVIKTGKDPYTDRDFLLIFNVLLVGVMAIILFSITETSKHADNKIGIILLLSLAIVTIIINGIALSAILFRISEWGITPNRLAVLGSNILILTNLLMVTYRLFKMTKNHHEIENVEKSITTFLPIYSIWTIIVTFIFPVIFNFK